MSATTIILHAGSPELSGESGLCRLWDNLALQDDQGDPFCCTSDWNVPFHAVFTPGQDIVAIRGEGSLVALTWRVFPVGMSIFHPLESGWLYGNPLLGPDGAALLAQALPELGRLCATRFAVVLAGIRPGTDATLRLVRELGGIARIVRKGPRIVAGGASLEGGLDGWLSRRSANHRAKLKKARRRAKARGIAFERHVPGTAAQAEDLFRRILAVERRSWKGLGHCGMAEEPYATFYGTLLARLAQKGLARAILARCDGRDIGFVFGGLAGGYYRGQQFSYDLDWADWSVGNLLQAEQVAWLCEEGALRYDVGDITGPRMDYKTHWTEYRACLETWLLTA